MTRWQGQRVPSIRLVRVRWKAPLVKSSCAIRWRYAMACAPTVTFWVLVPNVSFDPLDGSVYQCRALSSGASPAILTLMHCPVVCSM